MKKKKGFTLVELLVVIVIIGIIIGILIPAVANLQKSQNEKKFSYFTNVVKEAADLYVEKYAKSFDDTVTCFNIDYDYLIDDKLLTETDITCQTDEESGTGGVIQINRIDDSNNFTYNYYLTCKNTSNNQIIHEGGSLPAGCSGIHGNFVVNVSAVTTKDNREYKFGDWTGSDIKVTVDAINPYYYYTDVYQYSTDGGAQTSGGKYQTTNSFGGCGEGAFGQGASVIYAGGGGGWYGGGVGHSSAGGGSGYIGGVNNVAMQNGIRTGAGYARITYLG